MYSGYELSKYVLQLCEFLSKPITNIKLQKILYFLQIDYYRKFKVRLIKEDFYCWYYGPVLKSVYYEFKKYGILPITGLTAEIEISDKDAIWLYNSVNRYLQMSLYDLIELSKKSDPYKYSFQIFGYDSVIHIDDIQRFALAE